MLRLGNGVIVLVADLLDPQGRNPKDRPAVIVTPEGDLAAGRMIQVVAITTLIPDPLPDDHVLLPWQHPRHPRTGLNKRCAAVGSWLASIEQDRAIRPIGFVPGPQLDTLAQIIKRLAGQTGSGGP